MAIAFGRSEVMPERKQKPQIRFKGFSDVWERDKLGEISEIVAGGDIDKTKIKDSGKYPVYANALTNDGIVGYYDDEFRITAPAVTVTGRGDVGHAQARNVDFTPVVRLLALKTKQNCDFIENAINRKKVIVESTGVPQLTVPQLENFVIEITSIKEQTKIGAFFRKLDNLITLHQRKYEKLLTLKKSCIEKMFPKNENKNPEIRFKGFSAPWKQHKLSNVASMHARIGWQNLRTSEFLDSGNYYLITGTDFVDGKIDLKTCHFVEKERYNQDKNIQIKNGSILITKDGTLGKVAYVEGLDKPATLNAGVFNIVIIDKNMENKYLFQYLKAPFLMDYVGKRATGGTIKHLNQNILVDFPVIHPSYEEQTKIGVFFSKLDDLIALHQRKLKMLQNIKKSCLEKMFV